MSTLAGESKARTRPKTCENETKFTDMSSQTEPVLVHLLKKDRSPKIDCLKEHDAKDVLYSQGYLQDKICKFRKILKEPVVDLMSLRDLGWRGVPFCMKSDVWKILAGLSPVVLEKRQEFLWKERKKYWKLVKKLNSDFKLDCPEGVLRQIQLDVPRMSPNIALFRQDLVQRMLERILYVWSKLCPGMEYVQGLNDLLTPFLLVFLYEHGSDVSALPDKVLYSLEADIFWCFTKLVSSFRDLYAKSKLGMQLTILQLVQLIRRIDSVLDDHLTENGLEYVLFTFRWFNNLLTRELPPKCVIRLWDTLLSETPSSRLQLFLYISVAFLLRWRSSLLAIQDFQGLMLFLQNPPTSSWTESDLDLLLAEAFRLKTVFAGAPGHFKVPTDKKKLFHKH